MSSVNFGRDRAGEGPQLELTMDERRYRVIWIRERDGREVARGVLFPGPLTHEQACTVVRKTTSYPLAREATRSGRPSHRARETRGAYAVYEAEKLWIAARSK